MELIADLNGVNKKSLDIPGTRIPIYAIPNRSEDTVTTEISHIVLKQSGNGNVSAQEAVKANVII
jgi:hypothetical protein